MKLKLKFKVVKLFLSLLMSLFFLYPQPAKAQETGKVVLFLIDKASFEEVTSGKLPHFQRLIREGSLGLMNNRGYRGLGTDKAYLSIGLGRRADASGLEGLAGNIGEKVNGILVEEIYQRRTQYKPQGHQILHFSLPDVLQVQSPLSRRNELIFLGDFLNQHGVKTACLGNADAGMESQLGQAINTSMQGGILGYIERRSVVVAMDSRGRVNDGNVSKEVLLVDPSSPFGVRLNIDDLQAEYLEALKKDSFIVIDFGDIARADHFQWKDSGVKGRKLKKEALSRADEFLGKVVTSLNKDRDLLLVLAPSPPLTPPDIAPPFSPIIVWGKGFAEGLIYSSGTKRKGILNNVDVAPTILNFYDIKKPTGFSGDVIETAPFTGDKIEFLTNRLRQAQFADTIRSKAVIIFILLQLFLYISLLFVLARHRRFAIFSWAWRVGAVFVLGYPLAFYLLPIFVASWEKPFYGVATSFSLLLLLALAAVYLFKKGRQSLLVVLLPLMVYFAVDLLLQNPLSLDSVFGYSSLIGARFYGLGNEGMAIFLAAFLLSAPLLLKPDAVKGKFVLASLLLLFLVFLLLVGWPTLGADLGGTITVFLAVGAALSRLYFRHLSWRNWLALVALAILLVGVFALVDFSRPSHSQTHLGRTLSLLVDGKWSNLTSIISRKAATNLRVLRYSNWSYLFVLVFLALIFLNYRPSGWLKDFLAREPVFAASFTGALTGGVVGFLANDSGIVIPALIMSYFACALFWGLLEDFERRGKVT